MRIKTSPYYYVQKTSQDFTLSSLNVFRHVKLWFISYPNVLWVKCKWWTPEPNITHPTKLQEQSWGYWAQNWFVSKKLSGPQDPGRHISASQNWLSLVRQEKMHWGIRCNLSASQNPIGTLQEMGEAAGDKKHPKGVRSHQRMCGHEGAMVLMQFLSVFSQDRGEVGFMGGRGNIVLYKVFFCSVHRVWPWASYQRWTWSSQLRLLVCSAHISLVLG